MYSKSAMSWKVLACSLLLLMLLPLSAFSRSDMFTDSDDYKDKNFKNGILVDYKDLKNVREVNWAWVEPGTSLSDYKVVVDSFDDATDEVGNSQLASLKTIFKDVVEKSKGSKGTLTAVVSIYEVQKYSPGKAWIPFAGGHQMQAGVGVEVLLKTKSGKIVGKIRHFARNGITYETAVQETADDIKKFITKN